jgi:hypothetical protein
MLSGGGGIEVLPCIRINNVAGSCRMGMENGGTGVRTKDSFKNADVLALRYSQLSLYTSFWDVTPCSREENLRVSEQRTASIIRS